MDANTKAEKTSQRIAAALIRTRGWIENATLPELQDASSIANNEINTFLDAPSEDYFPSSRINYLCTIRDLMHEQIARLQPREVPVAILKPVHAKVQVEQKIAQHNLQEQKRK